ncbi:MAG: hypothetical protein KAH20_03490 [Methylococcales bacterium]|nr:hypothetical protein [Methylococcales bacterium]MCK5905242.1 hypothetical protein [Gammaproteobacteria bacterium]
MFLLFYYASPVSPDNLCIRLFFITTSLLAEEQGKAMELVPMEVIGNDLNRQKLHQTDDFFRSFTSDKVFAEKLE